jgi:endogenous inhibitor of DNA gyrase (YacG/DUF329 family)
MEYLQSNGKCMRKNFSDDEFQEICSLTPWIEDTSRKSIRERVYCILNNITETQFCPECGNAIHTFSKNVYSKFCSLACGRSSSITLTKRKASNIIKYGVPSSGQIPNSKTKLKETLIKKYEKFDELIFFTENGTMRRFFSEREFLEICSLTPWVEDISMKSIRERISCIIHNITDIPICLECSNKVKFLRQNSYAKYCSLKCVNLSKSRNDKISLTMSKNYLNNFTEDDHVGTVYILHFPKHRAVKIGKSSNFNNRRSKLIKDFGEFNVIKLIETEECFKLESSLHQKFANYRICLEEGGGRTEFFKEEILNML